MKRIENVLPIALALLFSGCAVHHGKGMAAGGHDADRTGRMSRMCEMHAGKSPEEQRAAAEEHVRSRHGKADPDHVAHHQKMMDKHCAGSAPKT